MRPSSIKYYFKEGFSGLLKNRLMTIASMATVAACILIISFSYCVVSNLQYMLDQLEDSIGIAVFMDDNITSDRIEALKKEIESIDHVEEVKYISPDEALEELKDEWGADGILDGLEGNNNPLSNSFELALDGIEYQPEVIQKLNSLEGVRNIRHAQSETQTLIKINHIVQIIGIVTIAILAVISIVIIMNTIKISVYTRRNEINIMKFVGATDWFIRWPFIIEGVLIGFVGAIIPMLIAWPAYGKTITVIYDYFPIIKNIASFKYTADIFSILFPVSIFAGILLGTVGSITSIRKYLQV